MQYVCGSDSTVYRILAKDFGLPVLPESAEICLQYVTAHCFQIYQLQLPNYFPAPSHITTLYITYLKNHRHFQCKQPFVILGNAPLTVLTSGQQRNLEESKRSSDLKYDATGTVGTYQHNIEARSCNHCWCGKSS